MFMLIRTKISVTFCLLIILYTYSLIINACIILMMAISVCSNGTAAEADRSQRTPESEERCESCSEGWNLF